MSVPKPGQPVRGSQTGRPIMALLDLLGRRWILRILWELREEQLGFRNLQTRCDNMSPSVLSERLDELLEAGIIERLEEGSYALTPQGRELRDIFMPLYFWAERWTKQL